MNNQLIFFDIDGTLFEECEAIVPASAIQAIKSAQNNGHKCFINTGRPSSTIDKVITDIPFDGYICGCGTYIEYQNQQLFHIEIEENLRRQVIQASFDCGMEAVLEGKDAVYFPENYTHPFICETKKDMKKKAFLFTLIQEMTLFLLTNMLSGLLKIQKLMHILNKSLKILKLFKEMLTSLKLFL